MDDRDFTRLLAPDHLDVPDVEEVRARGRTIRRRRRVGAVAGGLLALVAVALLTPGMLPSVTMVDIRPVTLDRSPPSEQSLQQALLHVEELPANWTVTDDSTELETPPDDAVRPCGRDVPEPSNLMSQVSRTFLKGRFLEQTLSSYQTTNARAGMQALADAIEGCDTWTQTTNGSETTWTLTPVAVPDLGDQTIAFRMQGVGQDAAWGFEFIFWRDGPVIASMAQTGLGAGDFQELIAVAGTAADKLTRHLNATPGVPTP